MEFLDAVKNRISCRGYNGKEVSDEVLDRILEVMQLAPTAVHFQSYRVRVSRDVEFVAKLGEIAGQEDRFKGATAVIVFFAVSEELASRFDERGQKLYSVQDATLACGYAQLAAADQGVESLWVGSMDEGEVLELCELTEGGPDGMKLRPVALSLFGYTDEKLERSERKELSKLVV